MKQVLLLAAIASLPVAAYAQQGQSLTAECHSKGLVTYTEYCEHWWKGDQSYTNMCKADQEKRGFMNRCFSLDPKYKPSGKK